MKTQKYIKWALQNKEDPSLIVICETRKEARVMKSPGWIIAKVEVKVLE